MRFAWNGAIEDDNFRSVKRELRNLENHFTQAQKNNVDASCPRDFGSGRHFEIKLTNRASKSAKMLSFWDPIRSSRSYGLRIWREP